MKKCLYIAAMLLCGCRSVHVAESRESLRDSVSVVYEEAVVATLHGVEMRLDTPRVVYARRMDIVVQTKAEAVETTAAESVRQTPVAPSPITPGRLTWVLLALLGAAAVYSLRN